MQFNVNNRQSGNRTFNLLNKKAAYRQTPLEHTRALRRFVRPGMNPARYALALQKGKQYEKRLPSYWDDKLPRKDLNPSSSFIRKINHLPRNNTSILLMGNRAYVYPQTSKQAGDMVSSRSLGRYYNMFMKRK